MKKTKENTKKNTSGKKDSSRKTRTEKPFDEKDEHLFKVDVVLSPENRTKLEFKSAGKSDFLWDDLLDSADKALEKKYPTEFFPKAEFDYMSFTVEENGNDYHVFPKSQFEEGQKMFPSENTFLVLEEATYCISKEYRLYRSLLEKGIIDEDETPFDPDKMREILDGISKESGEK